MLILNNSLLPCPKNNSEKVEKVEEGKIIINIYK